MSCVSGGGRPGPCDPESLSFGEDMEGCRVRCSSRCSMALGGVASLVSALFLLPLTLCLSAPSLDHLYNSHNSCYTPKVCGSAVSLASCNDSCDGAMGEMGVYSGPSHVGEEHDRSSPGSATYNCSTPRNLIVKFHIQIGRQLYCFIHEGSLHVAKARWHPLVRVSLGGGGVGGAIRLTGFLGQRAQRPEQRPAAPLCQSCQRAPPWCRGEPSPRLHQRNSGWSPVLPSVRGALHFRQRRALAGGPALPTVRGAL